MPTLKDVELKIKGVKKTKQITKAMNMVATSRLRGAQQNMEAFRPYAGKFAEVLGSLAEKAGKKPARCWFPKRRSKRSISCLCTSDRGLCGGFNFNLIDKAKRFERKSRRRCHLFLYQLRQERARLGRKNGEFRNSIWAWWGHVRLSASPPPPAANWWTAFWVVTTTRFMSSIPNSSAWPNRCRCSSCCRFRHRKGRG
jgi:hypothetical protein